MKILIVDDVAYLREELHDALERVSPGNEYSEAENFDGAVKLVKKESFDIAFLDVQMPGKNGLEIAQSIKRLSPKTNIVMVTAYSEYAVEAFKLFVSGYILKPVNDDDLRSVLGNLRTPVEESAKNLLEVRCFGNFEVFANGKPLEFKRSKEKEVLAFLVSLKGASANRNEICANIFEDSVLPEKANINFRQIFSSLMKDLKRQGFEDAVIHSTNVYSIDVSKVKCDYYDYLTGKATPENSYYGEFMNQYSWAEQYVYALENY